MVLLLPFVVKVTNLVTYCSQNETRGLQIYKTQKLQVILRLIKYLIIQSYFI